MNWVPKPRRPLRRSFVPFQETCSEGLGNWGARCAKNARPVLLMQLFQWLAACMVCCVPVVCNDSLRALNWHFVWLYMSGVMIVRSCSARGDAAGKCRARLLLARCEAHRLHIAATAATPLLLLITHTFGHHYGEYSCRNRRHVVPCWCAMPTFFAARSRRRSSHYNTS